MVEIEAARQRMRDYLLPMERRKNAFGSALPGYKNPDLRLVIVKEFEYEFGWVFCYNTNRFVETGDHAYGLGGNAPIIVDRQDGQLYITGTAYPLEHYIAEYRKGVRRRAEPVASPSGGPAAPSGKSGGSEGPPSVS